MADNIISIVTIKSCVNALNRECSALFFFNNKIFINFIHTNNERNCNSEDIFLFNYLFLMTKFQYVTNYVYVRKTMTIFLSFLQFNKYGDYISSIEYSVLI